MPLKTEYLEGVYGAKTPGESREAYAAWAASYDADTLAQGYTVPSLGAAFLARHAARDDGPVLDAGCGTGQVGQFLRALNFAEVVGADLSPDMLAVARATGAYARLIEQDLSQPIPEPDGAFAAVGCFGAFGPGHAPPRSLEELARVTRPGGVVVFNVREDSYDAQGFAAKMADMAAQGLWRERERSPAVRAFLLTEPELVVRVFVFEVLA